MRGLRKIRRFSIGSRSGTTLLEVSRRGRRRHSSSPCFLPLTWPLGCTQVASGMYTLRVQAVRHADYQAEVTIEAGSSPQEIDAILSTTVVDFSFRVTPTAIIDQYDVALVVTYSTDLIKPALVVSPAR